MKKKILLIDTSDSEYHKMLLHEMRKYLDVTSVSKYYSSDENAYKYFFPLSEKMKRGKIRKIIRGFEYIWGYIRTLTLVKTNKFDAIHIQWALIPKVDFFFFKRLRKYTEKIIYTAHDVIPHVSDKKSIRQNAKLYNLTDNLIVHGEYCVDEINKYYPEVKGKIIIQHHGVYEKKNITISDRIYKKHELLLNVTKSKKIVLGFLGQINEYKGIDVLIDAWSKYKLCNDIALIIAGKTIDTYKCEFKKIEYKIKEMHNIYFYNDWFDDEEEELFYSICDIIILPYKTASMSGVVFSAAKHSKTVISTTVGCLKEYLVPAADYVYFTKPNAVSIQKIIDNLLTQDNIDKLLEQKGICFGKFIYENYSWKKIVKQLIYDCYRF